MEKNRPRQEEIYYQNRLKAMTHEGLIEETNHFRNYYRHTFVVCALAIYAVIILGVILYGVYGLEKSYKEQAADYKAELLKLADYTCMEQTGSPHEAILYQNPLRVVCMDKIMIEGGN